MSTLYGFIPHRLNIDIEPKFSNFPYNVMFMGFAEKDGKSISGTSLYNPDISTYLENEEEQRMIYRNQYGGNSFLEIRYKIKEHSHWGEKYVNGESVGSAFGRTWKQFFLNVTMLGLSADERCEFKDI